MRQHTTIALVVAVSGNGIIGRDGGLPWHLSTDLKTFRRLTMGKPIIMGRNTFQSIGSALDGRDNIVVTRNPEVIGTTGEGIYFASSLDAALDIARAKAAGRAADEIMIIGGAQLYADALHVADRIYWTEVHATIEGDTTFPAFDRSLWAETSRTALDKGKKDDFETTLVVFDRR